MTWGKYVAVGVLLVTVVACSGTNPPTGVVSETPRVQPTTLRPWKPVRPTLTPVQARPGASSNARLMPVLDHGPRDKKQVALTFDADLTALMRKRLTSGKVKSYYN